MSGSSSNDELGCGGCIVAILLIGAVIGAIISVAALIDPFSWMPPVGEIWAECEDDYATSADECDLAERYPGFWGHVAVNFAYTRRARSPWAGWRGVRSNCGRRARSVSPPVGRSSATGQRARASDSRAVGAGRWPSYPRSPSYESCRCEVVRVNRQRDPALWALLRSAGETREMVK
jgi:hypothetical protein